MEAVYISGCVGRAIDWPSGVIIALAVNNSSTTFAWPRRIAISIASRLHFSYFKVAPRLINFLINGILFSLHAIHRARLRTLLVGLDSFMMHLHAMLGGALMTIFHASALTWRGLAILRKPDRSLFVILDGIFTCLKQVE